jgi:hypothetical protein
MEILYLPKKNHKKTFNRKVKILKVRIISKKLWQKISKNKKVYVKLNFDIIFKSHQIYDLFQILIIF